VRLAPAILLTLLAVLSIACAGDHEPSPVRVVPAAGGSESYAVRSVALVPPENEPDFDVLGPAWSVEPRLTGATGGYTLEIPVPDRIPDGYEPQQLSIAAREPPAPGRAAFWILAPSVDYDAERGVLTTVARGPGTFAVAVPGPYWSVAPSTRGNYAIHYVAEDATRELVLQLAEELEAATSWFASNGYSIPEDEPWRVFVRPLRGGRGVVMQTVFGGVLLLSDQLARSPTRVASVVTHELFHLAQPPALLDDEAAAWIREATAEFVAVQRLGVDVAAPRTDASCANYSRSITDTRGLNEYQNWTFVAFLEDRSPGFVQRLLANPERLRSVEALGDIAGPSASQLLVEYAEAYRLSQSYPLVSDISCPTLDVTGGETDQYVLPPLAALLLPLDVGDARRVHVSLTLDAGSAAVKLLRRDQDGYAELVENRRLGEPLQFTSGCTPAQPPLRGVVLVLGSGAEGARIDATIELSNEC
jgi:hypothetical protein